MTLPPPVLARPVALPSDVSASGEWWRVVGDLHPAARVGPWSERAALAGSVLRDRLAGYGWAGVHWGPVPSPGADVLDCSGFVSCVLARLGVATARCTSSSVSASWPVVPAGQVAPGDVVWWSGHVGIVVVPGTAYMDAGGEGRESIPTSAGGGAVRMRRWTAREGGPRAVHRPPAVAAELSLVAAWLGGAAPSGPLAALRFRSLPK